MKYGQVDWVYTKRNEEPSFRCRPMPAQKPEHYELGKSMLEMALDASLKKKALTMKAFDTPDSDEMTRWEVEVGKRSNYNGKWFDTKIDGRSLQINEKEIEALGIEPENNIVFYIEIWQ